MSLVEEDAAHHELMTRQNYRCQAFVLQVDGAWHHYEQCEDVPVRHFAYRNGVLVRQLFCYAHAGLVR